MTKDSKVVPIDNYRRNEVIVWSCGECSGQEFILHQDGLIACASCNAENIAMGWFFKDQSWDGRQ